MERKQTQNWYSYLLGAILAFFIVSTLFGKFEPTIDEFKTSDRSTKFNDTIDDVVSYGWSSLQLAVLGLLIVGGVGVLRSFGFLGFGG